MASPITWRNIDAPNFADAFRGVSAAQQALTGGLNTLDRALQQERTTSIANWDNQAKNNTQAFLDELASARTPEELAAKQAQLAAMKQGFGAQIDSNAARTALDGRGGVLQQRALTRANYEDNLKTRNLRDPLNQALTDAVFGRTSQVEEALSANPELQGWHGAEIAKTLLTGQRGNASEARAAAAEADAAQMRPLQRKLLDAQIGNIDTDNDFKERQLRQSAQQFWAGLNAQKARERQAGSSAGSSKLDSLARHAAEVQLKNSPSAVGHVGEVDGDKHITSSLIQLGIKEGALDSTLKEIKKNAFYEVKNKDGTVTKMPMPAGLIVDAIGGNLAEVKGKQRTFWFDTAGTMDGVISGLKKRIESDPALQESIGKGALARNFLENPYGNAEAYLAGAGTFPSPSQPQAVGATPPPAPVMNAPSQKIMDLAKNAPSGTTVQQQIDAAKGSPGSEFFRTAVAARTAGAAAIANSPEVLALEARKKELLKAGKPVEANAIGAQLDVLKEQLMLPKPSDQAEKKSR